MQVERSVDGLPCSCSDPCTCLARKHATPSRAAALSSHEVARARRITILERKIPYVCAVERTQ
eukprot:5252399-Pleurochrysis_carterae.AAC.1